MPHSWGALTESNGGLIPHPAGDAIARYVSVPYGEQQVAIGFVEDEVGWIASADLDGDGFIGGGESVRLEPDDHDKLTGVLKGSVLRGEVLVPVTIRLGTVVNTGTRIFGFGPNTARRVTLPNGVWARLYSSGGIYDHPSARIVVDENGDGEVDDANWLVAYKVSDRIVQAQGARWRFDVAPDGSTVTLHPTNEAPSGLRVGRAAPPFSVTASDGEVHNLDRYRGSPLLLDFWATWCAPCIFLHPEVEALAERHGLAVLGISADDEQVTVNRWLKMNPTPWPSAAEGPDGPTNLAYGVDGWPSHGLIDSGGKLRVMGSFDSVRRALGEQP